MSSADLVRAQYSGSDFNTHLDDLRARVQVKYSTTYNDFAASALGMMLLDSVSFGLDTLSFYLDRRATDTYLSTARTRKSVSRLTRQLGYKMRAAVSSSVDLSITIASPGFNVTMPKGFQFSGPDDLIYENAQDTTWLATDSIRTKSVACYEGVTVVESFVSDGSANQVFQLKRVPDQSFIVSGSVVLLVNGGPFQENEFLTFDLTDQFEVGYNDDPPTVRFGDGVAGNIPIAGASISVTYVASRGLNGLVNSHTITAEVNPLVISFQPITMTVDNSLGSVGGDDPESLDHAKTYAPLVYKSRFVAITRPDYEALSGAFADPLFGRVAVAQAISSRSAASDTDLNTSLAIIASAVDIPLLYAAGPVTLDGSASVAPSGVVTGSLTRFLTELVVGSTVKFGTDTVLRQVTVLTDDLQCTVSPAPFPALPSGTIIRYGKDLSRARSGLKDVNSRLVLLNDEIVAIASKVTDLDADLVVATTQTRTERDNSISTKLDAEAARDRAGDALTDATYGINNFGTAPIRIGLGANGSVVYAPKTEGVTVAHVTQAAGPLTIVVTGSATITVTFAGPGGSTAQAVQQAINNDVAAGPLVQASYTGTGLSLAEIGSVSVPVYTPPTTKTNLQAFVTAAQDKADSAATKASGMGTGLDGIVTTLGDAQQKAADIGLTNADGQMAVLDGLKTNIQAVIGPSATLSTYDTIVTTDTLATNLSEIETFVVSNKVTIQEQLDQIFNHVDAFLSADCKANLVTVPILARDKAGFFSAPSNGLIHALQGYLDARKEVTQTVQVTSGARALVPVVIKARIGVDPSFSQAITQTAVETAIDNVLRGRKFGAGLYLSELSTAVNPLTGVSFANIQIIGPQNRLDTGVGSVTNPNGNLIVLDDEVVTKGQVTVTTEVVSGV